MGTVYMELQTDLHMPPGHTHTGSIGLRPVRSWSMGDTSMEQ